MPAGRSCTLVSVRTGTLPFRVEAATLVTSWTSVLPPVDAVKPNVIRGGTGVGSGPEVTVANFGINSVDFLVDAVSITFPDRTIPRCKYTMLDGERQGYWADFFRRWAEAGRRTVIRENEVAVKTASMLETLNFADVIQESVHHSVTLEPYSKDPYTFAMVGVVVVDTSGEEVPMALLGRSRIGNPHGS